MLPPEAPSKEPDFSGSCCGGGFRSASSSPFLRKPIHVVLQQERGTHAPPPPEDGGGAPHGPPPNRHLTLTDLLVVGIGGTIGSGLFVLTGQVAGRYAGPATCLSFALAGLAAAASGACFAELAGRLPVPGSTYVYAYLCLGELPAVLAAACLTLEYVVSGAAVARSWGDKLAALLAAAAAAASDDDPEAPSAELTVNLPACFLSAVATLLLLVGVQESKQVTNVVTVLKMLLVAFMTVTGFALSQRRNLVPFAPYGARGVLRGATTSFFGYLGFDEVCCVASEALHPERDLPRAVLGTLLAVTLCYVLGSLALTGMLPSNELSPTSGFPAAFAARGLHWAAALTSAGELVTLPVVVLISLMAQPRLTLAMARDGLLPPLFARRDGRGNLFMGTLVAGVLMTAMATFVPFTCLNDLVSAGILVAFSMTCSCLILLRCQSTLGEGEPQHVVEYFLAVYNGLCFVTSILWSHDIAWLPLQWLFASILLLVTIVSVIYVARICPTTSHFGGSIILGGEADDTAVDSRSTVRFQTPCVPYLPCAGMAVNWYLIAQLDAWGILFLLLYLGAVALVYLWRCAPHSVGHRSHWSGLSSYQGLRADDCSDQTDHVEMEKYPSPSNQPTGALVALT